MTDHNSHDQHPLSKVMISGTYDDLKSLRDAMKEALHAQGLPILDMAYEQTKVGSVLSNSLDMVRRSSVYVAIIGWKYGKIPTENNPDRLSLTELEYNAAKEAGITIKVFIVRGSYLLETAYDESDEGKIKLAAFKKRLEDDGNICTFFENFHDFDKKAVHTAIEISKAIEQHPKLSTDSNSREGKVRGERMRPSTSSAPPPARLIKNRSPRELVEDRFTELLRPILRDLKSLLKVNELALAFLPPRRGNQVPDLSHEEYADYEKVRISLMNQSKLFRRHELSRAIVIDTSGELTFHDDRNRAQTNRLNRILNEAQASWDEWVDTELSQQISRWLAEPAREIVCGLKYIPSTSNCDVIGYVVVPRFYRSTVGEQEEQDVVEEVEQLLRERLLPVLRHLVLALAKAQVHEQSARGEILNTILEAAVSLSGGDWGCIKSSTMGAARMDVPKEHCEVVQAVCVHNCPRFFQEGRLVETEALVARAVNDDRDMVLDLDEKLKNSNKHPATQMAVFLIRDLEKVIEPQLPKSDVVGAIVIQHTAPTYLRDYEEVYSPFMQGLAELTARATRAAASKSLVSILRTGITGDLTSSSFMNEVDKVISILTPGADATWVLLQPDENNFKVVRESTNKLGGLQTVLKSLIGAEGNLHDQSRLAAFACNSTMSLVLQNFHLSQLKHVGTISTENFAAAYFHEMYESQKKICESEKRNAVFFDLGSPESWSALETENKKRWLSLVVGPVVSPTGRPVGVLAALREVHELSPIWGLGKLRLFESELTKLRDELYANHLRRVRKLPIVPNESGR
ncbi:MAG TPA: DUF4062 domain-containing protein [Pyrinomonadaceae bacterium]|nr:DUF4062 domain-containing protein [Pyrinomonadaceae bacterium]